MMNVMRRLVPGGLAAMVAACALTAGPASAAATPTDFYAAPNTGDSASCASTDPCSLATALADASSDGDIVHLAPGVYGFANEPVQYTITHAITIEGTSGVDDTGGPNRAVIESDRGPVIDVHDPAGTVDIQDVEVEDLGGSDTNAALELDSAAMVDRVIAESAGGTACHVTADAVEILDSLCDSVSGGGEGVYVQETSATATTTLRNDTVIDSGAASYGLVATSFSGALTVDLSNTILSAPDGASISAFAAEASASTTVNVDHSNYDASSAQIAPCCEQGMATLTDGGGNQTTSPPDFRDPATYDFRETASSPTVDAGADGASATLDLQGSPRGFGSGPDIGAYEYVPAPSATTGDATAGHTAATVNGTVDPKGVETHDWFEYWPESDVLQTQDTAPVDAGAVRGGLHATAGLTGLQPGTTYEYQAFAASAGGVTEAGTSGTFTTTDVPTVSTGAASDVDDTTATVSGTVNPNGAGATWSVRYGVAPGALTNTASGGDASSGTTSEGESVTLSDLQPATTYYYRVFASNVDGNSTNSATQSFTTSSPPAVNAATPSSVARTTARIGARIDPKGRATDYHFEYRPAGTTGSYAQTPDGSVPAGMPADVITALTALRPATEYEWRIVATHGTAGSQTVTLAGDDFHTTDIPAVVTGAPSGVKETSATVSGTANPTGAPRPTASTQSRQPTAPVVTPKATAPVLTRLRIAPRAFAANRRPRPTISYRDSQRGKTRFRIERVLPGVRHGKRCVAPHKHGQPHVRHCRRLVAVRGSFTHAGGAGIDRLRFSARQLASGSYRLIATPRSATGIAGQAKSTDFRVLAKRPRKRHMRHRSSLLPGPGHSRSARSASAGDGLDARRSQPGSRM